jgi:antirestriction protein ArdC
MSNAVYKIVNEKIIKMIEEGNVTPWQKPWSSAITPKNLVTKYPYRGVNTWMLLSSPFKSPYWVTWNQVQKLGGSVKSTESKNYEIVVFWKILKYNKFDPKKQEDDEKSFPLLRYYRVYNLEQVELPDDVRAKLVPDIVSRDVNPIAEAERIVAGYKDAPVIEYGHIKAAYSPTFDKVMMPDQDRFVSDEKYYATLFHELIHSTGAESRLKRFKASDFTLFGDATYSKEELVAEMGASYLCAEAGIESRTIENAAAYIKGWLSALKSDDGRMIVFAASKAQKAADYILSRQENEEKSDDVEMSDAA